MCFSLLFSLYILPWKWVLAKTFGQLLPVDKKYPKIEQNKAAPSAFSVPFVDMQVSKSS